MIQFNLLPSVKAEYVKAQRMQRTVMVASGLITAVSVFMLILLLVITVFQKHDLNNLFAQVKTDSAKLQKTTGLNQILTIQNQLTALATLHGQKPVATLLLGVGAQDGYLGQVTPAPIAINDIKVDFNAHTININGSASSINDINTYVDTLKFTTFSTTDKKDQNANAFTNVILSSFSVNNQQASCSITMSYNPDIFSGAETATLTVPSNKITTQSVINQPLFQSSAANSGT